MEKRILFATKDIGPAKVMGPVIKMAQKNGYGVRIYAEGLAVNTLLETGIELFDCNRLKPNYAEIIRVTNPDVVVITSSSSINIEREFACAASNCSIPVVLIEDYWGVHSRLSNIIPTLVITLDEYAAELARTSYGDNIRTVIAGNHSIPASLNTIEVPVKLGIEFEDLYSRLCLDRIIVFLGGTEKSATTCFLQLMSCVEATSVKCAVIPRFHPKIADKPHPDGGTWGDYWNTLMARWADRIITLETPVSTDLLVALADVTAGDHSSLLFTAAATGNTAISLRNAASDDALHAETHGILTEVPAVKLGVAIAIEGVRDLSKIDPPSSDTINRIKPFEPEVAYRAILGV